LSGQEVAVDISAGSRQLSKGPVSRPQRFLRSTICPGFASRAWSLRRREVRRRDAEYYERSQYVIENTGRRILARAKTNPRRPQYCMPSVQIWLPERHFSDSPAPPHGQAARVRAVRMRPARNGQTV